MQPDAAFHDIGKLVNWDALGLPETTWKARGDPHEFQRCIDDDWNSPVWGITPDVLPWQTIFTDHEKWPVRYGKSLHRWHRAAADQLASGFSRGDETLKKGFTSQPQWGRYSLWAGVQFADHRLSQREDVQSLISLLNSDPSWEQIEGVYLPALESRAEEAKAGLNVTTLLSHVRVVSKLGRVLERMTWNKCDPAARVKLKSLRAHQHTPPLSVSHFRLHFRYRLFRTRDIGVFNYYNEALGEVIAAAPENVLSRFGFECACVFESEAARLAFIKSLAGKGFDVEERTVTKPVAEYLSTKQSGEENAASHTGLMAVLDAPWQTVYPNKPPARIDLPLCEACQMARAERHWPADHVTTFRDLSEDAVRRIRTGSWRTLDFEDFSGADRVVLKGWLEERGEEDLCAQCFGIREKSQKMPKLAEWNGYAAWLRIRLDLDGTIGVLDFLRRQYLKECDPSLDAALLEQSHTAFPLVADFVQDYYQMCGEVHSLLNHYAADDVLTRPSEDLWLVPLAATSDAIPMLQSVVEHLHRRFPKIFALPPDVAAPIQVSLSVSRAKHPFYLHWRFFEEIAGSKANRPDIAVQTPAGRLAVMKLSGARVVLEGVGRARSERRQLHRLGHAAAVSQEFAEALLTDKTLYKNRGERLSPEPLASLAPRLIDFQSLLALADLSEV